MKVDTRMHNLVPVMVKKTKYDEKTIRKILKVLKSLIMEPSSDGFRYMEDLKRYIHTPETKKRKRARKK